MTVADSTSPAESTTDLVGAWRRERVERDGDTDGYRAQCRAGEEVSTVVALTVAAVLDQQPTDLPPLAETVDPDALARLVDDSSANEVVTTFPYADYSVTVRSTGGLVVTPNHR